MKNAFLSWLFEKLIRPIFWKQLSPFTYTEVEPNPFAIYHVHATRHASALDPSPKEHALKLLVQDLAHDLIKNGLIQVQETVHANTITYKAHLVAMRKQGKSIL